jgi:hypothetical protein
MKIIKSDQLTSTPPAPATQPQPARPVPQDDSHRIDRTPGNGRNPAECLGSLSQSLATSIECIDHVMQAFGGRAPLAQMEPLSKWKARLVALKQFADSEVRHGIGHRVHNPQTDRFEVQPWHPDMFR